MKTEALTASLTGDGAPAAPAIQVRRSEVLRPPAGEEMPGPEAKVADMTSDPAAVSAPPRNRADVLKRWTGVLAIAGLAAVCVYAGARWWVYSRTYVKTDNAYLAAHIHQVSSRVAGTVKEVLVEDNQSVIAGTVLARLDSSDFEIRLEQAKAEAAQAHARIEQAQAQVAQARAQLAREQAQSVKAKRDLERAEALSKGTAGAISRQEFDQAQAAWDAAEAACQASESAVKSALSLIAVASAQAQAADAAVREAELQLGYTDIRAPAAGRIGKRNLEAGNRVQPGQALMAVVQPDVWVVANFKETQLTEMKPGMPVEITVDMFPGRVFRGRVESVAPASGSQFALLPPDNATGNFTRIVQRVPVKIVLDTQTASAYAGRFVPGMSALVRVKVG